MMIQIDIVECQRLTEDLSKTGEQCYVLYGYIDGHLQFYITWPSPNDLVDDLSQSDRLLAKEYPERGECFAATVLRILQKECEESTDGDFQDAVVDFLHFIHAERGPITVAGKGYAFDTFKHVFEEKNGSDFIEKEEK